MSMQEGDSLHYSSLSNESNSYSHDHENAPPAQGIQGCFQYLDSILMARFSATMLFWRVNINLKIETEKSQFMQKYNENG